MKKYYNQTYIVTLLFTFFSFIFIPCLSKDLKTYYVYSKENKSLPSSKYININDINKFFSLINDPNNKGEIRAILADGHHYITQTLQLNNSKNKIIIEALHHGKAILTSYNPISNDNITFESNHIISFSNKIETIMLNVNGKYVVMPYSVEKNEAYAMKQFSNFKQEKASQTYSATFSQKEIEKMEVGSYIFIFCKWIQYKLKITHIDYTNRRVTMNGMNVNMSYIVNDQKNVYYTLYNSRKFIKPSSFCAIDNKIYYQLDNNEKIEKIEINQPTLKNIINISGCNEGITLRGLVISGAIVDHLITKEAQGGANSSAAINIQKSSNINIENCEFSNNCGYSIKLGNNSSNCVIQNNYFHDLQGGGILIGNYDMPDSTNNILIKNNLIKSFGKLYANSEGILVTKANHITITNNTICDGYYTGISLGWTWGYGKSYSYGNYIANNHIHHLMQGLLSDGAGIYTLGNQKGTIIEKNYIHDVISRVYSSAGSSLLYFDEGTSNVIAKNNVCFGSHTGFHEHYGKYNVVERNVFAYTNQVAARLSNYQKDSLLTVKNNTFILDCGKTFNRNLVQYGVINNNKFWSGEIVDKTNGLKTITNKIDIIMNVKELHSKNAISQEFSYGVTTKNLKEKAKLTKTFLNEHNKKVCNLFPNCSSYFKRNY